MSCIWKEKHLLCFRSLEERSLTPSWWMALFALKILLTKRYACCCCFFFFLNMQIYLGHMYAFWLTDLCLSISVFHLMIFVWSSRWILISRTPRFFCLSVPLSIFTEKRQSSPALIQLCFRYLSLFSPNVESMTEIFYFSIKNQVGVLTFHN